MKRNIIRQIYFYAASLITLVIMIVSGAQLVNLALKSTIFPKADRAFKAICDNEGFRRYENEPRVVPEKLSGEPEAASAPAQSDEERAERTARCEKDLADERSAERQRDFVQNFSMLIVSAPVFWFHFRIAQREREEEREEARKSL